MLYICQLSTLEVTHMRKDTNITYYMIVILELLSLGTRLDHVAHIMFTSLLHHYCISLLQLRGLLT